MYYDEEALMEDFDQWKSQDKIDRFMKRMQHKFDAKERRYNR